MKRKIMCILLSILLLFSTIPKSFAVGVSENKPLLSEMSESECVIFVKKNGIELPRIYDDETEWGRFIKDTIIMFEKNPYAPISTSYTVIAELEQKIRNVVNDYYDIGNAEAGPLMQNTSRISASELEHSTVHLDWDPSFTLYNCYSFALGITDVAFDPGMITAMKEYPSEPEKWFVDIVNISIEEIRDLVILDLEARNNTRIIYEASAMDTSNLCTNESVICVRKGLEDYHFMKYTSVGWLHKPATTQILKYNYVPTESIIWTNERVYMDCVYEPTTQYDSAIYFISYNGHDWDYTSNRNGTHIRYCNICGDEETLSCEYEYTYFYDDMHNASCKYCDNGYSGAFCTFDFTSNGDGTHTGTCVCGNTQTYSCYMEYTNVSNATHSGSCVTCGYSVSAQQCTLVYEQNGGQTHTASCTKCENRRTQNCSHRYVSHGDNTHSYLCSLCGYVKIDHAACLFNANNICRICGAPKNGAVINKHEEVTPE